MQSKVKTRPAGTKSALRTVKPLMLHDVTNTTAPASAAPRRRFALQPAPAAAYHARHHVSRQTQA